MYRSIVIHFNYLSIVTFTKMLQKIAVHKPEFLYICNVINKLHVLP